MKLCSVLCVIWRRDGGTEMAPGSQSHYSLIICSRFRAPWTGEVSRD